MRGHRMSRDRRARATCEKTTAACCTPQHGSYSIISLAGCIHLVCWVWSFDNLQFNLQSVSLSVTK